MDAVKEAFRVGRRIENRLDLVRVALGDTPKFIYYVHILYGKGECKVLKDWWMEYLSNLSLILL